MAPGGRARWATLTLAPGSRGSRPDWSGSWLDLEIAVHRLVVPGHGTGELQRARGRHGEGERLRTRGELRDALQRRGVAGLEVGGRADVEIVAEARGVGDLELDDLAGLDRDAADDVALVVGDGQAGRLVEFDDARAGRGAR